MFQWKASCRSHRLDLRGTGDSGGHFSDDRYLGIRRGDKDAFYV